MTRSLLLSLGLVVTVGLFGACGGSDPAGDATPVGDRTVSDGPGNGDSTVIRPDRNGGTDGGDGPGPTDGPPSDDAPLITDGPPPDVPPTLDFSCLGNNVPPAPAGATVTRLVAVLSPTSMMPVPSVAIELLDRQGQSIGASGTTNAEGQVTLQVPVGASGFDGAIRMTATGYVETYGVTDVPITVDGANVLLLVTPAERDTVAALADVTVEATNSAAIVLASDCIGNAVPDAQITADVAGAEIIYVNESIVPDRQAQGTFSNGLALIGELPPGPVTLTMRAPIEEGGQPQTIGTLTFTARNGTLSEGLIQPD